MTKHHSQSGSGVARLLEGASPRAAGLIVTIYGDVVVPRGGQLWMGSLIAACRRFGISESLVRTAVSRLVAGGRLEGERHGRRSHYRLSSPALHEFETASRLFYGPDEPADGFLLRVGEEPAESPPGVHHARLAAGLRILPWREGHDLPPDVLAFSARAIAGRDRLAGFAAAQWDLDQPAHAYRAMMARFEPFESLIRSDGLSAPDALTARLLLVHEFRRAVLKDPRLPPEALPGDWPGPAARRLFARLYLGLSPAADSAVPHEYESTDGALPATTRATRERLASLALIADEG